ncbi:DUF2809 domain-containing protein [Paenibacillus kandeliae]|uniref:ribosomal maturation YjgA family protein n=1 Tax=Paenibacillus kandeliae TaxID=3231269 RepID=UPI00345909AD
MNKSNTHVRHTQPSDADPHPASLSKQNHRKSMYRQSMKWRMLYAIAALLTMVLGLASRRYDYLLPTWLAEQAGDALWAGMIYWGLRLLTVPRRIGIALLGALFFSYGIECSQLYQAEWINAIRATTLGALVLGHGFLVADLFRYTAGVLCMYIIDILIMKKQQQRIFHL